MRKRRTEIIVGIFALTGFIILVFITINLKRFFFFSQTYDINVLFKRVSGLEVGAPVYVYGVQAGEVKQIQYIPGEYPAKIVISLTRDIKIYKNATIRIVTAGLIGETKVEIEAGNPDTGQVKPGDSLYGAEMVDLYQTLSLAPQIVEDVSATIHSIRTLVTEDSTQQAVRESIQRFSSLSAKVDDLITTTSTDIRQISDSLRDASMKLDHLITDTQRAVEELRNGFHDTQEVVVDGIAAFKEGLTKTSEDVRKASISLEKTSSSINSIIEEENETIRQTLQNLQQTSEHLKKIANQIESGRGTIGELVNDPGLYDELRETLIRLQEVLSGLMGETRAGRIQYE